MEYKPVRLYFVAVRTQRFTRNKPLRITNSVLSLTRFVAQKVFIYHHFDLNWTMIHYFSTNLILIIVNFIHGNSWTSNTWLSLQEFFNTRIKNNKAVGFYGPIAPPVPNAPELRSLHAAAPPAQSA